MTPAQIAEAQRMAREWKRFGMSSNHGLRIRKRTFRRTPVRSSALIRAVASRAAWSRTSIWPSRSLGLDERAHPTEALANANVETVMHHRPPSGFDHVSENVDKSNPALIR